MAAFLRIHDHVRDRRQIAANARVHPLQIYNDVELIQRYRFSRNGIQRIENLIHNDIVAKANRNHPIEPLDKVCAALHFFATGCFQRTDGDTLHLSQASMSRCIAQVSDALSRRLPDFVRLPDEDERRRSKMRFFEIAEFPGVVGVIDGTHVKIIAPTEHEDQFVNRKRYHSINVQVVMDAECKLININACWPGSTHDSRVLRESRLEERLENIDGHLLGDSGYPLRPWLLTPVLRPQSPEEERYNQSHRRTRTLVERGIGQLKRRFHCLHEELRVHPSRASKIIASCAVLHNLAKDMGMPDVADLLPAYPQPPLEVHAGNNAARAQEYRRRIIQAHFR
ncbi:putative nuclease HARBI1 [Diadema setosum]|uniref:putative nuclease HARBI1 n=1 Tax=Diadema setosum TaxID=31175 RepID=UPI003B3AD87D